MTVLDIDEPNLARTMNFGKIVVDELDQFDRIGSRFYIGVVEPFLCGGQKGGIGAVNVPIVSETR